MNIVVGNLCISLALFIYSKVVYMILIGAYLTSNNVIILSASLCCMLCVGVSPKGEHLYTFIVVLNILYV